VDRLNKRACTTSGLSGGGALYAPAISSVDPNIMIVNCDISGVYITTNGGKSWRMIHHTQLLSNTCCRPAFHPKTSNVIFAANGLHGPLMVSTDEGVQWEAIGDLSKRLREEIANDPGNPDFMLVGVGEDVWRSCDGGRGWVRCEGHAAWLWVSILIKQVQRHRVSVLRRLPQRSGALMMGA